LKIELYHASKYGNGAKVAEEFQKIMIAKGHGVNVHHVSEANAKDLPKADLYIFGSPGRIGKPIGKMRRFLKDIDLPTGTICAIFSTEGAPRPNKKTGEIPSEEEIAKYQRIQPIMNEMLQEKGLKKVADMKVYVTAIKGPLEDGWQKKVEDFAVQILKSA
jgi:flavodoxin